MACVAIGMTVYLCKYAEAHFSRFACNFAKCCLGNKNAVPVVPGLWYQNGFQMCKISFLSAGPIADAFMATIVPAESVKLMQRLPSFLN